MTSDVAIRAYESRQESGPSTFGSADGFLQLRLQLLAKVFAALFAGTWTVNTARNLAFYFWFQAGHPASKRSLIHGAMALGWTLFCLGLRRGAWLGSSLGAADAPATVVTASVFAAILQIDPAGRT